MGLKFFSLDSAFNFWQKQALRFHPVAVEKICLIYPAQCELFKITPNAIFLTLAHLIYQKKLENRVTNCIHNSNFFLILNSYSEKMLCAHFCPVLKILNNTLVIWTRITAAKKWYKNNFPFGL